MAPKANKKAKKVLPVRALLPKPVNLLWPSGTEQQNLKTMNFRIQILKEHNDLPFVKIVCSNETVVEECKE